MSTTSSASSKSNIANSSSTDEPPSSSNNNNKTTTGAATTITNMTRQSTTTKPTQRANVNPSPMINTVYIPQPPPPSTIVTRPMYASSQLRPTIPPSLSSSTLTKPTTNTMIMNSSKPMGVPTTTTSTAPRTVSTPCTGKCCVGPRPLNGQSTTYSSVSPYRPPNTIARQSVSSPPPPYSKPTTMSSPVGNNTAYSYKSIPNNNSNNNMVNRAPPLPPTSIVPNNKPIIPPSTQSSHYIQQQQSLSKSMPAVPNVYTPPPPPPSSLYQNPQTNSTKSKPLAATATATAAAVVSSIERPVATKNIVAINYNNLSVVDGKYLKTEASPRLYHCIPAPNVNIVENNRGSDVPMSLEYILDLPILHDEPSSKSNPTWGRLILDALRRVATNQKATRITERLKLDQMNKDHESKSPQDKMDWKNGLLNDAQYQYLLQVLSNNVDFPSASQVGYKYANDTSASIPLQYNNNLYQTHQPSIQHTIQQTFQQHHQPPPPQPITTPIPIQIQTPVQIPKTPKAPTQNKLTSSSSSSTTSTTTTTITPPPKLQTTTVPTLNTSHQTIVAPPVLPITHQQTSTSKPQSIYYQSQPSPSSDVSSPPSPHTQQQQQQPLPIQQQTLPIQEHQQYVKHQPPQHQQQPQQQPIQQPIQSQQQIPTIEYQFQPLEINFDHYIPPPTTILSNDNEAIYNYDSTISTDSSSNNTPNIDQSYDTMNTNHLVDSSTTTTTTTEHFHIIQQPDNSTSTDFTQSHILNGDTISLSSSVSSPELNDHHMVGQNFDIGMIMEIINAPLSTTKKRKLDDLGGIIDDSPTHLYATTDCYDNYCPISYPSGGFSPSNG
ncbi:hypothetical protein DFA_10592 [Cavenderia fasciculata]|uniref:Uncharacterized protein n=1 Tax=Cavenderia fasciculata TaxID=261658 RepID=F4QAN0_CACFS|nr:uncharacterized protein DFA_10592 [Cavenderia fasciculata]EGG15749.1 hypothetical protein DFA_10592 [Cavenderia fasciculata]|eukprot:XP_004354496.1 hypothetical protein DFA_10592 [Cavenderia fasciculata]